MGLRPCLTLALIVSACAAASGRSERTLVVTASAYNSISLQTDGDPATAAWGDRLEPGMRTIAVSRDLLGLGLRRGVSVRIDELPGEWTVLDKMAPRWQRKIDIYMGDDVAAARLWGRRQVTLRWRPQSED